MRAPAVSGAMLPTRTSLTEASLLLKHPMSTLTLAMHLFAMQDSAELWNGDALQAGELFQHLFMEGEPTCLANNR